ncbi:MAG TPA: glycosyltransferase family 2 protein [Gemmatimonadales bacterium]|nr:glycosyltransferase family 2 protein [Gemmatimonadales bacterium]
MAARRVSVGIVNHNGESYLEQTLRAVARLGPDVDDVLLIDSGSTDRGPALVGERFPHVRVIELGANLGPGAARNRAIQEAAHDRILLIDNDVEPEPGSVSALASALDDHATAVAAMAAVLYEAAPDTVQYVGAEPHFLGTPILLHADTPAAELDRVVRIVGTAITCCIMVDRIRFGSQPWFDERLFFYLEDHEFGLRASLQGYDCLAVPAARCLHRKGTIGVSIRETGRFTAVRVRYTMRNRWLTILMLYQARTLFRLAPALAVFEVLQFGAAARKGWLGHWLWAVGSAVGLLPHVRRVRRTMRTSRRRADLELLRGGPFPFNAAWRRSGLDRAAGRMLDLVAGLNWRLAGGRA